MITDISMRSGLPKTQVAAVLDAFIDSLKEQLVCGNKVQLSDIGYIYCQWKFPRINPILKQQAKLYMPLYIPYSRFKLYPTFKEKLKQRASEIVYERQKEIQLDNTDIGSS